MEADGPDAFPAELPCEECLRVARPETGRSTLSASQHRRTPATTPRTCPARRTAARRRWRQPDRPGAGGSCRPPFAVAVNHAIGHHLQSNPPNPPRRSTSAPQPRERLCAAGKPCPGDVVAADPPARATHGATSSRGKLDGVDSRVRPVWQGRLQPSVVPTARRLLRPPRESNPHRFRWHCPRVRRPCWRTPPRLHRAASRTSHACALASGTGGHVVETLVGP